MSKVIGYFWQDPPPASQQKPVYVLEQLPDLRDELTRGISWPKVAETQRSGVFDRGLKPFSPRVFNSTFDGLTFITCGRRVHAHLMDKCM